MKCSALAVDQEFSILHTRSFLYPSCVFVRQTVSDPWQNVGALACASNVDSAKWTSLEIKVLRGPQAGSLRIYLHQRSSRHIQANMCRRRAIFGHSDMVGSVYSILHAFSSFNIRSTLRKIGRKRSLRLKNMRDCSSCRGATFFLNGISCAAASNFIRRRRRIGIVDFLSALFRRQGWTCCMCVRVNTTVSFFGIADA